MEGMKEMQPTKISFERLTDKDQHTLQLVLFVDQKAQESKELLNKFSKVRFPESFEKHFIYTDLGCPICNFFGIKETPVLAVIRSGSILALVEDCDEESCSWLVEFTEKQLDHIQSS